MIKSVSTQRTVDALNRRLSRRGFLAFSVGSLVFITSCGDDDRVPVSQQTPTASGDDDDSPSETATGDPQTPQSSVAVEMRTTHDSRNFPQLAGWSAGPKPGGTLVIPQDAPPHWDVVSATAGNLASWTPRHFNQLITFKKGDHADNHSLELEGDLAESWDIVDDVTYVFHIAEGVKWQDLEPMNGRDLTAADIQYALEVYRSESAVLGPLLEVVDRIEAPDDHTLRIILQEPAPYFLRSLAQPPMLIFGKEAYESSDGLQGRPVGTGPYILTDQGSRVGIKMEKNPTYFKRDEFGNQLPYLDRLETVFMPDAATNKAAFRNGTTAYYSFFFDSLHSLNEILGTNPETVVQVNPPAPTGQIFIALRLDKEPWNDVRVRRALSLAINRDAIIDAVFQGVGVYSQPMDWTYFGSEWPLEPDQLGPYMRYDPDAARELLEEAGMAEGIRGTLVSQWNQGAPLNVLELIQADWREIGVDIQIETPDSAAFFEQFYAGSFQDMAGAYFLTQGTDPDNFTYELMHSGSPKNIYHINDQKVDDLSSQQRVEMDPDKRRDLVQQITDHELDQVFRIWTVNQYKMNIRQPWTYNITDGLYAWCAGWACGVAERFWTDRE